MQLPSPSQRTVSATASALTTAESLIWTGQRLDPQSPLYNMAVALEVQGSLDLSVLRQAWRQLVADDDVLRTVIRERDGQPCREVMAGAEIALEVVDRMGDAINDEELQTLLEQWTAEQLPLSDPLLRARVICCRPDCTLLYLNQHHICTDARSLTNLFKRWGDHYRHLVGEAPAARRDVPRFADHVAAERRWRGSPKFAEAKAFWEAPTATPRGNPPLYGHRAPGSGRSRRTRVAVGADRAARLRAVTALAPFRALTPAQSRYYVFATVMAAWLHRVGDTRDVAIGTPWHNRTSARLKDSLGLFMELYPLRVSVEAEESWASLAGKVADFTMTAARHVVSGASSAQGVRGFQTVLNYITADLDSFAGRSAQANWIPSGYGDPQHVVRLQVHDFGISGEPTLDFDLDIDLFDELAQGWVVDHFLRLLDALLEDPEGRIDSVPLVTWEDEALFAPRGADCEAPGSILGAIRAQATRTPDAVAVIDGARRLSYRELAGASARVAAALALRGVGPQTAVGILLDRSAELVVTMLAVLEAGAAYVPLDPDHPDERLQAIAREAELDLIVVAPAQAQRAHAWGSDTNRIHEIETDLVGHAATSAPPPSRRIPGAADLAYVLYTSGSTGRPKGVEVTHGALADYASWAARSYTDGTPTRFPLFTSPAFDLTVTSIFTPLVTGGAVVVYRNEAAGAALLVRRVFEDDQVDVVKLTPAHLGLIRDMDLSGSRVRRLILGGENLTTAAAARAFTAFGGRAEIVNEYGPTEATVGCMIHRFAPERDTGDAVSIGVPADNVRIHVLDTWGRPVPRGCRGEIHIGGRRLARGYRGDADRTAQAFVRVPGAPDALLYKTGDVGRWDAAGRLDFLGRTDGQVKLRGVRMELGEVEAALLRHSGIHEVALQVVRGAPGAERCCRLCGLEGVHPEAHLDHSDLCAVCRRYDVERDQVSRRFGTRDDLMRMLDASRAASDGPHDTLMLLSGGAHSTYALYQLVELGARPLVFMLDHGFISDQARVNVEQVVSHLGLELVTGHSPAMRDVLTESLTRYSHVRPGVFKVLNTLATNLAAERGIPTIVTGLSRGRIAEAHVATLHQRGADGPAGIDHDMQRVDFYRYNSINYEKLLTYIDQHAPWIRSAQPGGAPNAHLMQAGGAAHQAERGFRHNALRYSWDVRLGHMERAIALAELDAPIDSAAVQRILNALGYRIRPSAPPESRLFAYYTSRDELGTGALRRFLADFLPAEAVPSGFVRLARMPLTANGKVDHRALPQPADERPVVDVPFVAPSTDVERRLAEIWGTVLGRATIGTEDDFFELGGDSIHCIQIVSRAREQGLRFEPRDLFAHPTIAALAAFARTAPASAEPGAASVSAAELAELEAEFGAE